MRSGTSYFALSGMYRPTAKYKLRSEPAGRAQAEAGAAGAAALDGARARRVAPVARHAPVARRVDRRGRALPLERGRGDAGRDAGRQ
eukprot:scaffold81560_cov33-Phaeocystis_antarctica.AAC.1